MAFSRMVDMSKTPQEKAEAMERAMSPMPRAPDYPYGLCISLSEDELEKLEIDYSDVEVGHVIDLRAFAEVTSISKTQVDGKECCRIELQITELSCENESTEES